MSVETTKSVWEYDAQYFQGFDTNVPDCIVLRYNGDYYAISNADITFTSTGICLTNYTSYVRYNSSTRKWGGVISTQSPDICGYDLQTHEIPYTGIYIMAQNLDPNMKNYYTSEQFRNGYIYAPAGTIVDGIYTHNVLDGVLGVLPVLLVVMIGFIAIRKGVLSLFNFMKGA